MEDKVILIIILVFFLYGAALIIKNNGLWYIKNKLVANNGSHQFL